MNSPYDVSLSLQPDTLEIPGYTESVRHHEIPPPVPDLILVEPTPFRGPTVGVSMETKYCSRFKGGRPWTSQVYSPHLSSSFNVCTKGVSAYLYLVPCYQGPTVCLPIFPGFSPGGDGKRPGPVRGPTSGT